MGRVGSKVVGAEGSQLEILGTVELDMTVGGITAKQLFYICNNLRQSSLLGMDFLRDNGCVVDFNGETLQAGSIQVKLRNESSWEVHMVSLVESVTIQPDRKIDLVCQINGGMLEGIQGVLEAMEKLFERFPVAVPSTLFLVRNRLISVRFYNYSDQPVTIDKNTGVQICPGLNANEMHVPHDRHHKVSSLINFHQNTPNSVKYEVIWKCQIIKSNMKYLLNNTCVQSWT